MGRVAVPRGEVLRGAPLRQAAPEVWGAALAPGDHPRGASVRRPQDRNYAPLRERERERESGRGRERGEAGMCGLRAIINVMKIFVMQ